MPRYAVYSLVALLGACLALVYWLGITSVAGVVHDDVVYLVTAKALALGEGYRIISMPGEPWQIAYPPLYSALLAVVWKLAPEFPANVMAFKALNIPLCLLSLLLTYQLVVRVYGAPRAHGALVVALLAMSMPFVVFIDLTMSELLYLAVLLVTMRFLEPLLVRAERETWRTGVLAGVLVALPLLVRQVGLGLVAALAAYLLLKRRFKLLAVSLVTCGLLQLPWQGWIFYLRHSGAPLSWDYVGWVDANTGGFAVGAFVHNAFQNAWTALSSSIPQVVAPTLQHATLTQWLGHMGLGWVAAVLTVLVVAAVFVGYFRTMASRLRLFHLYLPMYLGLVFLIPWDPTRYVATTVPFLLFCLVEAAMMLGWGPAGGLFARRPAWRAAGSVLAAVLLLASFGAGAARVLSFARHGVFHDALLPQALAEREADQRAMAAWAREAMPPNAVWLHPRDPLIYLLTGRQALTYSDGPDPSARMRALFRDRPTYVVTFARPEFLSTDEALVMAHPERMKLAYQAPHGTMSVYRISSDWP